MHPLRSGSQGNASAAPPSIDALRQRARHRLIGAAVLVVLGVVGFSLLLDTPPRPLPVDIPIVIPAKPVLSAPSSPSAPVAASTGSGVAPADSLGPREAVVSPGGAADRAPGSSAPSSAAAPPADAAAPPDPPPPSPVTAPVTAPKTAAAAAPAKTPTQSPAAAKPDAAKSAPPALAKTVPQPDQRAPARPAAVPGDGERARALLNGQNPDAAAAPRERVIVQVGAFADATRAREVRIQLERAGLKTYTHVAETAEGRRIRVRLGPFASRAEADKAAARVKALGLPAAILTL